MSIKVMTNVWEHSAMKGSALLLLLAIADHADDDGLAFPGTEKLAKKIRMSERQVKRLRQILYKSGELEYISGGKFKGDKLSVRVTNPVSKGDKPGTPRVTRVSPEPSIESSREPSEKKQPPSMPTRKPDRRQSHAAEHMQLAQSSGLSKKDFFELTNAYLDAAGGRLLAESDGPDADRELNKAKDSAATGLKMGIKTPADVEARLAGHRQQWKEDSVPSYGQLLKAQPVTEQAVGISQPLIVEAEGDGFEW